MENESYDDGAPPAKRYRRSHHKNQLPALCYCARCRGEVRQKPRTIDDHEKRYGQQLFGPEPHYGEEDSPEPAGRQAPGSPYRPAISSTASVILSRSGSPTGTIGTENAVKHPTPPSSPLNVDVQEAPPHHPRRPGEVEEDEEDLVVADEVAREYPFDQLFDEDLDEHDEYRHFLDLADDLDIEELDPNDGLHDENFGLPDGEDQPRHAEPPRFQLPADEEQEPEPAPDDVPGDEDDLDGQCAAFQEPDLIRNAYIDAFVQKSLYGGTHRAIKHQLKAARRTISTHPEIHAEDIAKMAQSIGTAERRLGVSTDSIITTFTLCPVCKRRYSPEYIAEAIVNTCLSQDCPGILFSLRRLASGGQRRVSNLTFPFASPIAWIRHILKLAGMPELMQSWRNAQDDNEEMAAPISSDQWMRDLDRNKPIGDMCDGWGWRSTEAGLERREDPNTGDIVDESMLNPPVRFVSLPFGLSLSLNTDWFQATKEGNYSVGACYLVINNLPRHVRFLRENISLCLVMPGPNEPKDYALDQMLGPLIDELLELKQGVNMTVRWGDPPVYREELVHGDLTQHIADLIARIKVGGGAGVKSEVNFCLYCHTRLSSLSVPAGYLRQEFLFRDPQEELNNVYRWKSLPTAEEQKLLFDRTGNRFTALHRIPGWHTSSSSPPDSMHLLHLGGMNWLVKQVLVGPGMLTRRHPGDEDPQDIFNDCLDKMWMPKNFQRLPPKLGQTRVSIKADQWKLTSRIIYVPLFLALRDNDEIRRALVPRGTRSSPAFKHQAYRAKLLHQQREKYFRSLGRPDQCPPLEECYPTRDPRFHYRQILRYCLATNTIDKRSITPAQIEFAQNLLESLCVDYARNNIQLPPNFHYMMHLEESILKSGSLYNTHVWGLERANGILSRINHNGKGNGILEGTLMRGWWNHATVQNLIKTLRALPNRTPADDSVIEDLMAMLRGGAEHAQQRGSLMAFIAQCQTAYTRLHGIQDSTRLSSQSRIIDLEINNIYPLVLQFCVETWPNAGIFGPGMVQQRYLAPVGMVRNHSFVEYDGIRYGAYTHTSGKGYCYGYINGRHPVRIERILHVEIPGEPHLDCVCALVRLFQPPPIEAHFPWDAWSGHLGVSSWAYDTLGELVAIPLRRFSGTLALFDVPMSYGRYWVTISLDSLSAEQGAGEDDDE